MNAAAEQVIPEPRVLDFVEYIGIKRVRAVPMTLGDYGTLRSFPVIADEDQEAPGYLIEYLDGGAPNTDLFEGYISWSPKGVFDNAYRAQGAVGSFSNALEAHKAGHRIARLPWIESQRKLEKTDADFSHFSERSIEPGESLIDACHNADLLAEDWVVLM